MTITRTLFFSLLIALGTSVATPVFAQTKTYSAPAALNKRAETRSSANQPTSLVRSPSAYHTVHGRVSANQRVRRTPPPTTWAAPFALSSESGKPVSAPARPIQRRVPQNYRQLSASQTTRDNGVPPDSSPPAIWNAPTALHAPGYTHVANVGGFPVKAVAARATKELHAETAPIATTAPETDISQTGLEISQSTFGTFQPVSSEDTSDSSVPATECACQDISHLHFGDSEAKFFLRGWLSQGFTWNPDAPRNNFNLPTTFNDRANEYQLNQLYVSLGLEAERSAIDWGFGGQVDLLYGSDYFFTTATGLETHSDGTPRWNSGDGPRNGGGADLYGLAMPQLFAEVWAPVGNGISLKFGHFYTTLGHEVVAAPENFFYSHAYTMQYGEPFTHTGFVGSTEIADGVTVHAGLTRGWDNWEDPNSDLAFLGGVELNWDRTSLAYAIHVGDEDIAGDDTRSSYSLVLTHHLTDDWRYIFQHDFGYQQNGAPFSLETATWYGINQYLIGDLTECLSAGTRFEWFRDHNNARVLGVPAAGGNYFNFTVGLNWRPMKNMVVRPELRWDWSDVTPPFGLTGTFDDFSDKNQFTLGTDVILSF